MHAVAKTPTSAPPACMSSVNAIMDRVDRKADLCKAALRRQIWRFKKPFRLLALPAEIRIMIYHHAMVIDEDIIIQPNSNDTVVNTMQDALSYKERKALKKLFNVNFLRTCREIYFEATPIFYRCNTFRSELTGQCKKLGMGDPWMRLAAWLKCIGSTNVGYLSKMVIGHPHGRAPWTLRFRSSFVRWAFNWLNHHSLGGASLGAMVLVRDIMSYQYSQSGPFQHVCNSLEAAGKMHILQLPVTSMQYFEVWPSRLCQERYFYQIMRSALRTDGARANAAERSEDAAGLGHWIVEIMRTTTYEKILKKCPDTGSTGLDEEEHDDEGEDNDLELDFDFGQKLVYRATYTP